MPRSTTCALTTAPARRRRTQLDSYGDGARLSQAYVFALLRRLARAAEKIEPQGACQ